MGKSYRNDYSRSYDKDQSYIKYKQSKNNKKFNIKDYQEDDTEEYDDLDLI